MQKQQETETKVNLFQALEMINDRLQSLALVINQMGDCPPRAAKVPVSQQQIDKMFIFVA